jgi:2-polyprenyl-6-methoxyphenol hydroxylase-like FAD-dependent oxidoreductase
VADIAIVGGGIGGLATALLLAREGRHVVVCERDAAAVPPTPDEMWSDWQRPGTPQARLGHTFLSGFRALLAERAPDVLERVIASGAQYVDFGKDMPGDERRPEDAELRAIMCRRPVLEGILRQAVQAESTVDLHVGCDVLGLHAEPSGMPGVPMVTGVRTRDHGSIAADAVVIAGGRLLPLRSWFEAIGAGAPDEFAEGSGFLCFTRYFRIHLRPGEDESISQQLTVEEDTGYMRYEIFGADRSTFCVELEPPTWDHDLRAFRHDAAHMAAARVLPEIGDWLDPGRSTPIGPVAAMGQERNVLRRFVRDGRPIALGLHVIGDARCQLNSQYAWGSGIALAGAVTLSDVLVEHVHDPEAQALAFEARIGAEIAGRHAHSLARDRAAERRYRGMPSWDDTSSGPGFIEETIVPAADHDAEVFRAVMRWDLQLDPIGALSDNTALHDRVRSLAAPPGAAPGGSRGPTRDALLELIAASAG